MASPNGGKLHMIENGPRAERPLLLILDDDDSRPTGLWEGYRDIRCPTPRHLDHYLRDELDPDDPPAVVLVDVVWGETPFGLHGLYKIRADARTKHTTPILYSHTAHKDGVLQPGFTFAALHLLLCASACGTGIHLAGKVKDDTDLVCTIDEVVKRRRVGRDCVGVDLGYLRFARPLPVITTADGVRRSLVWLLYGTMAKQRLWIRLAERPTRPEQVVREILTSTYPRPSKTLDSDSGHWRALGKYFFRDTAKDGLLGRLARAWWDVDRNLLDQSLIEQGYIEIPLPDEEEDEENRPSEALKDFMRMNAQLLGHPETVAFAQWYLEHMPV